MNAVVSEKAVEYSIAVKESNKTFDRAQIKSSADSVDYLRPLFGEEVEIFESFIILLLNRACKVVGWSRISSGGRAATVVDVAMIAKLAVDSLASAVILAHNHPSGNRLPSLQDETLTKKIKEALALFEVRTLDHVVITPDNGYYSFADEGRI